MLMFRKVLLRAATRRSLTSLGSIVHPVAGQPVNSKRFFRYAAAPKQKPQQNEPEVKEEKRQPLSDEEPSPRVEEQKQHEEQPQEERQQDERQEQSEQEKSNEEEEQKTRSEVHEKNLMLRGGFERLSNKNRDTYLEMLHIFERNIHRRNHVEFIHAALKSMKEFGVHRDLEVYRALLDVMPKGKFVATNMFQAEFLHYPKQQDCILNMLEQMEDNGVMPDFAFGDTLISVFGNRAQPIYKFWRMMYWMPKFRNACPWVLPKPLPDSPLELARAAVAQMCSVDVASEINVFEAKNAEDSIDDTWIVSGQSAEQAKLLAGHSKDKAVYIEGPFIIWLREYSINYFILRGDPVPDEMFEDTSDHDDIRNLDVPLFNYFAGKPTKNKIALKRSIHQQDDATIYAICATGTSSKDSLLSWVRLLQRNGNPSLSDLPVLFKFRSLTGSPLVPVAQATNHSTRSTAQSDDSQDK